MKSEIKIFILLLFCFLFHASRLSAQDALMRAMQFEIAQATTSLQLEGYPLPYFVSLMTTKTKIFYLGYQLGGHYYDERAESSYASADVRVGSHELDNHPISSHPPQPRMYIPMTSDIPSIRHALWGLLDDQYKSAAAGFFVKQAQRVEKGKAEYETDDMTIEEPHRKWDPPLSFEEDLSPIRKKLSEVSATFQKYPEFTDTTVSLEFVKNRKEFANSEGSSLAWNQSETHITLNAEGMSPDGMKQIVSQQFFAQAPQNLPSLKSLQASAEQLSSRLLALISASSTSPLTAPAILDPESAGALFEAMGTRLEGEEQRDPQGGQTFRDKMGQRILPNFLSLIDDPSQKSWQGTFLSGYYPFDDEGIPSQKAVLVEGGVLKSFLLSRYPLKGFFKSNGHGRSSGGMTSARLANLFVLSSKTTSLSRLKELLREEAVKKNKPYGLWIKHISSWRQDKETRGYQSFRGMPQEVYLIDAKTGKETLVRDLDLVGTPLVTITKVLWTGNDPEAHNRINNGSSGNLNVAIICPSMLVAEVEMQRSEKKPERLPILPPPK
ncbi:MAG: hypothetical protein HY399_01165 [Elusimicrobia bacterium]|nr:hypothetical protein [Elusimicrobiota bacterium]